MKITKILVPVDFSETSDTVTLKAVQIAKLLKTEIVLLHVVEIKNIPMAVTHELLVPPPNPEESASAAKRNIEKMRDAIVNNSGLKAKAIVETGRIAPVILEVAQNEKADLIIMGAHGESGFNEIFIGTNAQRVVSMSEIPVLTIGEKAVTSEFKKVLIPIDNSMHSRQKVNLSIVFAKAFNSEVHLIGLPNSEEKAEVNKFKIKIESIEKLLKENNLKFKTKIVHGESLAKSALDYAEENKCDLVVINAGHESNITGSFLGLFAQQIVNHSKIPVLNIRHIDDNYSIDTPGFGV